MERKVLLLASYCGDMESNCTENRPCHECLKMCNIYDLPETSPLGEYDGTLEDPPKPKSKKYFYTTKQEPNIRHESTEAEYEVAKDLARFDWSIE